MSNAEIIMLESVTHNIPETEALHTFQVWKKLGYSVKKGEHGIATRLWRYTSKPSAKEEEGETVEGHYYLAKSYLFSTSQVERIEHEDGGENSEN